MVGRWVPENGVTLTVREMLERLDFASTIEGSALGRVSYLVAEKFDCTALATSSRPSR